MIFGRLMIIAKKFLLVMKNVLRVIIKKPAWIAKLI